MNIIEFFSKNYYLFLPTKNNPRVAIAVDSAILAKNSLSLYNPFSKKAKLLKFINLFFFAYLNKFAKKAWKIQGYKKSDFVCYLESKLKIPLVTSVYFSTIKDKVVLQLQTPDAAIVGYLKYPLNNIGLEHLQNEKKAILILSKLNIINSYVLYDTYKGIPFLLTAPLDGQIDLVERKHIDCLLLKFRRENIYKLTEHPRIRQLKTNLVENNFLEYVSLLEGICDKSNYNYALVYEHGDFSPWNIVKEKDAYTPFDFEYFIEDGLEYFDLIKYYYQIGKLLKEKKKSKLLRFVQERLDIPESLLLIQIFLIKEIVQGHEEGESCSVELELLEHINSL